MIELSGLGARRRRSAGRPLPVVRLFDRASDADQGNLEEPSRNRAEGGAPSRPAAARCVTKHEVLLRAALGATESLWTIREDLATPKNVGPVRAVGWVRGARWALAGQ